MNVSNNMGKHIYYVMLAILIGFSSVSYGHTHFGYQGETGANKLVGGDDADDLDCNDYDDADDFGACSEKKLNKLDKKGLPKFITLCKDTMCPNIGIVEDCKKTRKIDKFLNKGFFLPTEFVEDNDNDGFYLEGSEVVSCTSPGDNYIVKEGADIDCNDTIFGQACSLGLARAWVETNGITGYQAGDGCRQGGGDCLIAEIEETSPGIANVQVSNWSYPLDDAEPCNQSSFNGDIVPLDESVTNANITFRDLDDSDGSANLTAQLNNALTIGITILTFDGFELENVIFNGQSANLGEIVDVKTGGGGDISFLNTLGFNLPRSPESNNYCGQTNDPHIEVEIISIPVQ